MLTNQAQPSFLLPNPFGNTFNQAKNMLNLNQIEGFVPVKEFTDETNTAWSLSKASTDSSVDIPDPKNMQVVDYWNTEFPGLKTKLYVYVVEGIRMPKVETEQPTRVLYQWFSATNIPTFTPQMITEREWLKANVYTAKVVNSRIGKLKAICHISSIPQQPIEDKPLVVEELNGNSRGNTNQN